MKDRLILAVGLLGCAAIIFWLGGLLSALQYSTINQHDDLPHIPGMDLFVKADRIACGGPSWIGKGVTATEQARITCEDLPVLEAQAMGGSTVAANRVADFFFIIQQAPDQGLYWTKVASENGDLSATFTLASHLAQDDPKNELALNRARFLFSQIALVQSNPYAARATAEITKLDLRFSQGAK